MRKDTLTPSSELDSAFPNPYPTPRNERSGYEVFFKIEVYDTTAQASGSGVPVGPIALSSRTLTYDKIVQAMSNGSLSFDCESALIVRDLRSGRVSRFNVPGTIFATYENT